MDDAIIGSKISWFSKENFNFPIKNKCKKTFFSHKKWSHLHPKGVNVNQTYVGMMKTISHKVVVICSCTNVDVDLLLACLGAWIIVLLTHVSTPCIFELRKVKVARNEKKKGIKVIMCMKK
jgi:hypothetical protein